MQNNKINVTNKNYKLIMNDTKIKAALMTNSSNHLLGLDIK